MKTICLQICLILSVILLNGCDSTEGYRHTSFDFSSLDKVAVLSAEGTGMSLAARNQISDLFAMELLKKGYSPIERSQIDALLAEGEFQRGELTTTQNAAEAGRILSVPAVMMVNVAKFKEDINMSAKLVKVEDGSILWMGTGTGTTGKTLATIAGAAAGAVVGVASTGEDDQIIGGVAGGVLGGVAGNLMSPQESKKAQQIISKMCVDLPQR